MMEILTLLIFAITALTAFCLGAMTYHIASGGKSPVKTVKQYITQTKEVEKTPVQEEIEMEKALHHLTPPNLFDMRSTVEYQERQLAFERRGDVGTVT